MRYLPFIFALPMLAACQPAEMNSRSVGESRSLMTISATRRAAEPHEAPVRLGVGVRQKRISTQSR